MLSQKSCQGNRRLCKVNKNSPAKPSQRPKMLPPDPHFNPPITSPLPSAESHVRCSLLLSGHNNNRFFKLEIELNMINLMLVDFVAVGLCTCAQGGVFECHFEPVSPHACLGVLGQEGVLGDSDLPHQGVDMGDTPVGVGRHAHPQHQFHPAHAELRSSELASSEREMRELAARCCFSAITTWSRSRDQRQIS